MIPFWQKIIVNSYNSFVIETDHTHTGNDVDTSATRVALSSIGLGTRVNKSHHFE